MNLFSWDEARFLRQTEGSAIRRIGYVKWQLNISVALGNAPSDAEVKLALTTKSKYLHILKESLDQPSTQEQIDLLESVSTTYGFAQIPSLTDVIMLIEHLSWALVAHGQSTSTRQQARLVRSIKKGLVRDA